MEVIKTVRKLCMCCMEEHEVALVRVPEHTIFKGMSVDYMAEYEYCEKADEYVAEEAMISRNDVAMKDAYRVANHLLTSGEIESIRAKYGMSQADLAGLLGWGGKTITRYESHQVQDVAHDCILKKLDKDPEWFLELLDQRKTQMAEQAYRRYRTMLIKLYEATQDVYLRKAIKAKYVRFDGENNCCGGVHLDLDKVVDVIRYFSNSSEVIRLYKVKLMKLLWYADCLAYKRRGRAITGLVYKSLPMGAVPLGYESIIDLDGIVYEEEDFSEGSGCHFVETANKDYQSLSEEEKVILESVICVCGKDSKRQIIDRMHKEKAYKETKPGDIIMFEYAQALSID